MYIDGIPNKKISNKDLVDEIEYQVREKIKNKKETNIIARS